MVVRVRIRTAGRLHASLPMIGAISRFTTRIRSESAHRCFAEECGAGAFTPQTVPSLPRVQATALKTSAGLRCRQSVNTPAPLAGL